MPFELTTEQNQILDAVNDPSNKLIKVNAIAGAAKTTTLTLIAKYHKHNNGIYFCYNKAIAEESQSKFPKTIQCSTIHSLAYRSTVKEFGLKIGFFKPKSIDAKIPYEDKIVIASFLEEFFLSSATKLEEFRLKSKFAEVLKDTHVKFAKTIFSQMQSGEIQCTHGFYLKLYHLLLANNIITLNEIDILMLDESGDINPVVLDIFLRIPAKKKIMVGDNQQNIYSFNETINGFDVLKDDGTLLKLSQSFRVNSQIAKSIESFMISYLDKDSVFKGVDSKYSGDPQSIAYISRTNSALVGKIIELMNKDIKFNTTRDPEQLFELPILLLSLKEGMFVYNLQYKFLEADVEDYFKSISIRREFDTPFKYIMALHEDDISIQAAANVIREHGASNIFRAYNKAKEHKNVSKNHRITLTTSHSSKGLEFDEVYIMDDMNAALTKVITEVNKENDLSEKNLNIYGLMNNKQQEEFRLYYVACSRAKHRLHNADYLEPIFY